MKKNYIVLNKRPSKVSDILKKFLKILLLYKKFLKPVRKETGN